MSCIHSIQTAIPTYRYSTLEIIKALDQWKELDITERELFKRFATSVKIKERAFAQPLNGLFDELSAHERAMRLQELGSSLATQALEPLLKRTTLDPKSNLILSSCSSPIIPGLDAYLANQFPEISSMPRTLLYQHGCIGGVSALRLAQRLAPCVILAVELCSLVFHPTDLRTDNILGATLFSDAAAAAYIDPHSGPLKIIDSESLLINQSATLMGYEQSSWGQHLMLARDLPEVVIQNIPRVIEVLLTRNSLQTTDITTWLIHPGGPKILSALEDKFKLTPDQTVSSWNVLESRGNSSSASIWFVIADYLNSTASIPGSYALVLGIGPGVSIEIILLEKLS